MIDAGPLILVPALLMAAVAAYYAMALTLGALGELMRWPRHRAGTCGGRARCSWCARSAWRARRTPGVDTPDSRG